MGPSPAGSWLGGDRVATRRPCPRRDAGAVPIGLGHVGGNGGCTCRIAARANGGTQGDSHLPVAAKRPTLTGRRV